MLGEYIIQCPVFVLPVALESYEKLLYRPLQLDFAKAAPPGVGAFLKRAHQDEVQNYAWQTELAA